jgi:glycine hydroxymethyltransferase
VGFGLAEEIVALWLATALCRRPPSASVWIKSWRLNVAVDTPVPLAHAGLNRPRDRRRDRQRTPPQNTGLELIASENFVSQAVLQAAGSVMTNKYAEGLSRQAVLRRLRVRRRRGVAGDRAREALFGAEHANVQPHSGAQANMAVYFTLLKPGDTVLGMNLAHGGHLTHGHRSTSPASSTRSCPYGVRKDDERIDYEELEKLAHEHTPKMIMVGASAYPRVIDFARDRRGRQGHRRARSSPTWRTSRGSSPPACIRVRCRIPISSPPRRTRRCAARAAAWCSAARSTRRTSIARRFPGIQGGPLMHIIAAKAVCFKKRSSRGSRNISSRSWRTRSARRPALARGLSALVERLPPTTT